MQFRWEKMERKKKLYKEYFISENWMCFLTSSNSQNLCSVLPMGYIGGFPVNNFVQCDFTSVLIDSEPGTWITSYTISVFVQIKIFRIMFNMKQYKCRHSYVGGIIPVNVDSVWYSGLLYIHFANNVCHFGIFFL